MIAMTSASGTGTGNVIPMKQLTFLLCITDNQAQKER